MCEQTPTGGNCKSSDKAHKVDENNEDERKEVTCKKSFTPDGKNVAGAFIDADTPADKCPEWKLKDEQKQ